MMTRYLAIEYADHGCCYGASVQDVMEDNATVCECRDLETAHKIAEALNAQEQAS